MHPDEISLMNASIHTKRAIRNQSASVCIDLFGGAITDFHLDDHPVNPLSFKFSKDQMPANNQKGAVYQGHFLCLGRWGIPSAGEINAGVPDHGEIANMMWEESTQRDNCIGMKASSRLEGLAVNRSVSMDKANGLYLITEDVTNINPLGRMYNMVQHPTIASPFLDEHVLVDCNALMGFDYALDDFSDASFNPWPNVFGKDSLLIDVSTCKEPSSSVFSFVVNPEQSYGWVTAFSPSQNLLIGYLWKRVHYPWINHWIHWSDETILYRGLEFGTTGIHKPFPEILDRNLVEVLNEKTYSYLDAGATHTRSFMSFLQRMPQDYQGVAEIYYNENGIRVIEKHTGKQPEISCSLKL